MLYHFQLDFSDIDRSVYQTLDFRLVQHPSETAPYLLTRALAYALSYQENLEFSPSGLSDPEGPALKAVGKMGAIDLWIEIGNPSTRKLHKAGKAANNVVIYTYKNADVLMKEISEAKIHRSENLKIFAFETKFLEKLEGQLKKNNRWSLLHQQGQLDVDTGELQISTELRAV